MNCGEYVPSDDLCPGCGKDEMKIIYGDKYLCANPRRCEKCAYESWKLEVCPKCGVEMELIHPYIWGDFACDLGYNQSPRVQECSEDEEILEISDSFVYFSAIYQRSQKIFVTCNYVDWYIEKCPNWITKEKRSNFIRFTALPNEEKEIRTAKIEIICGELKKEIVIWQYGLSLNYVSSFRELCVYLKHVYKNVLTRC